MNGGGFQMGNMPKSVTCYICGRGYGTKSIKIHIPNCEKKWNQQQELKPKKERRPCPQPPSNWNGIVNKKNITHKDLQKLNDQAFEEYNEFSLDKCNFCQRTFNPESFKRHQRICTAEKPMNPLKKNITQTKEQNIKPQKVQQNSQIKKNAKIFKPLQEKFEPNNSQIPKGQYNLPEYDDQQENQDLESCFKCGRNFASERIGKHQQICKGNQAPKKVKRFHQEPKPQKKSKKDPKWKQQHKDFIEAMQYMKKVKKAEENGTPLKNLPPPPKSRNPDFLDCQNCGRSFNPTAFERHSKVCANIVNKPKMLKRKNYGKNNRGY